MPGFDPLINQRLLPPSFPRQAEIFQRDKVKGIKTLLPSIFVKFLCKWTKPLFPEIWFDLHKINQIVLTRNIALNVSWCFIVELLLKEPSFFPSRTLLKSQSKKNCCNCLIFLLHFLFLHSHFPSLLFPFMCFIYLSIYC